MKSFEAFLIYTAKYGIWDIISVTVLFFSFLVAIRFFFFPLYRMKNLNFYVTHMRVQSDYSSRLFIEIRNFTNKNLVLSNTYFKPKKLIPHMEARGDTTLKRFELKFAPDYKSPDCLIIHGSTCSSWFPLDPNQSDEEIQAILHPRKVGFSIFRFTPRRAGNFKCKCTFLTSKPRTVNFIRKY